MFIRTKDGIIDLNRTHLDGSPIYNLDTKENVIKANENGEERDCYYIENDTFYHYWYGDGCIWEERIIKQSDTIEELIDGYVFVSKSGETHYVYFKSYDMGVCLGCRIENDEKCKNHLLENGTVYGAIWTSKGLIYVAKMNDKGVLELI